MTTERALICLAGSQEEIPDTMELAVGGGIVTLGKDQDLTITPAGGGTVQIQKALRVNFPVHLMGAVSANRVTTGTDYSDNGWEFYIGVTDTTLMRVITLAKAADGTGLQAGRLLVVKDETGAASSQTIQITAGVGETIDGSNKYYITTDYGFVVLMSNNDKAWWVLAKG